MAKMMRLFSIVIMTVAAVLTAACATNRTADTAPAAKADMNDGGFVSAKDRVSCAKKKRHHKKRVASSSASQQTQTTASSEQESSNSSSQTTQQ